MTKYRISFEIESDEDPSELLDCLQDVAIGMFEGVVDTDSATVEEVK